MYLLINSFSNNTRLPVTLWVTNTIKVFFFQFKCFCLNSTQVTQLFMSK